MSDSEKVVELEVVDYSAKSIAVFGLTKKWAGNLKGMGGRFNPHLKRVIDEKEVTMSGWIFKVDKTDEVVTFVEEANRGIIDVVPTEPKPRNSKPASPKPESKGNENTFTITYTFQKPMEFAVVLFEDGRREEYETRFILNDKVYLLKPDGTSLPMAVVAGKWTVLPYWNRPHDVLFKSS